MKTQTGRRRYLRDINSRNNSLRSAAERLAMNSPIQGTAADMLKLAMIQVHQALRAGDYRTKMLLTVHDEIVFDMHRDEQESVTPVIEQCMTTALPMQVPIVVEMGVGRNWLEVDLGFEVSLRFRMTHAKTPRRKEQHLTTTSSACSPARSPPIRRQRCFRPRRSRRRADAQTCQTARRTGRCE